MTKPHFHPWLCTPEAVEAAEQAAFTTDDAMRDELLPEALMILAECALPPRERWLGSRYGIRRHATLPSGHVGAMWTWPADQMQSYAVREIGLRLSNGLRIRFGQSGARM